MERARNFLGNDQSYRMAVKQRGRPLVYDDGQKHPLAGRAAALAKSTLWRWLSWLGGLQRTLERAMQLISQKSPRHTLHRQVVLVDPRKYRSEARGETLRNAGRLLLVQAAFEQQTGEKMFPKFATGCGWR